MATVIYFAAPRDDKSLTVTVEATGEQVFEAQVAAGGLPFPLEDNHGRRVYVNPATIAFWRDQPTGGGASFR